jgi:hypothetical protein
MTSRGTPKDERGEDAGAVLSGAAVEHRRQGAGLGQDLHCVRQGARTLCEELAVPGGHEGRLVVATEVLGWWQDVGEGKVVVLDFKSVFGKPPSLVDLALGAEVDHGRQAEVRQLRAVVFVETRKAVGAKELSPPDGAPVGARIPSEVTKVDAPRQGELAEWLGERVGHSVKSTGRVIGRAPSRSVAASG